MRVLCFADFFLVFFVSAELDPGASLGLRARNAGMLEVIGAISDVRAQLLFHLVVKPRAMKERRNHRTERGDDAHISSGCALSAEAMAATRRVHPSPFWAKPFCPAVVT